MMLDTGRLFFLARRAVALTFTRVCGREGTEYFGVSTWYEFGRYGWVGSGGVTPLSRGVLVGVVSDP